MKSHTDIPQSKQLVKFLPLESADMAYWKRSRQPNDYAIMAYHTKELQDGFEAKCIEYIPCWSLAALLNIIPNSIYDNTDEYSQLEFSKTSVAYHDMNDGIKVGSIKDNLVDACVEMILKLHELNLL